MPAWACFARYPRFRSELFFCTFSVTRKGDWQGVGKHTLLIDVLKNLTRDIDYCIYVRSLMN